MKIFLCTLFFIGSSLALPQSRIVGGQEARAHEFPYMISIQHISGLPDQFNKRHFCGGSILNENWVLTAAHCLVDFARNVEGERIEVVAGAHDVVRGNPNEQRRTANRTISHNNYIMDDDNIDHDIGLIKVNASFVFNTFVSRIDLPTNGRYYPEGFATVSGWGSVSRGAPRYPDKLQKAELAILPENECNTLATLTNGTNKICAGDLTGAKSICSADSGSPLVQQRDSQGVIQIGVVSWGWLPCGQPNKTGVFMNVSYYWTWIQQQIN